MLDIKFVRENPEVVKQNIRNKFQDNKLELVDKVLELDKENREIKQEVEALRAERNKISTERPVTEIFFYHIFQTQHILLIDNRIFYFLIVLLKINLPFQ